MEMLEKYYPDQKICPVVQGHEHDLQQERAAQRQRRAQIRL
jgi:hypothetical protein